ncbi:MAG: nicotinate phosphoribosyltransferase [Chloroflexi bacterium]|nr:nicotinate phosphoribosyltransferase [Chloroflexota bacterium]
MTEPDISRALDPARADIYFARALDTLRAAGRDAVAVMEIFAGRAGLLCGMDEVHALLRRVLPAGAEIWSLLEGEPIAAREVVLRIRAPYAAYGLYETAMLGILASESGWATAARAIVDAAAPAPVTMFGARHVHPDVSARMEYAAIIGGCATSATPAGAALAGKAAAGTMPHALVLLMGDTLDAARAFDAAMGADVPRIVLVDTFKDEAEEALRIAAAMGERLWGVRLDTPSERGRVTPELVKEVRARLDQAGHRRVKLFVSGGLDLARVLLLKSQGAPIDGYGVGSAISGAPAIDFTGDIKEIDGQPVAKRGRIPGLSDTPRLRRITLNG